MRYTVIGIYHDNNQVWAAQTDAKNPRDAARNAVLQMLKSNEWEREEAGNILVVDVAQGEPAFVLANEYLVDGSELVGKKGPKDWHPGEGRR